MRGFILGLFLPPLLSSLFRAGFKDDTAILHLSSLFGPDFEDEARRPATVGQSEAGRKHLAFLQNPHTFAMEDVGMSVGCGV